MLTSSALHVLILSVVAVSAYKRGPPVVEHPDICFSMSPKDGHHVDPLNRNKSAPFDLSLDSACYMNETAVTVTLRTTNNETWFEGFLVQARLASAVKKNDVEFDESSLVLEGTFDSKGDTQLSELKCGNTHSFNSLAQNEAHHYRTKSFSWTPPDNFEKEIVFVATVIHERDEYWMGVTSDPLAFCRSSTVATSLITVVAIAVLGQLLTRRQ